MKSTKEQIILGIDPGTMVTGYGVIKILDHLFEPLDFGAIYPPQKANASEKYLIIFNSLEQLIQKFHPDAIAVESQFIHKNPYAAMKLGIAKGVVLLAGAKNGVSIFEYAPKKAKLAVAGNGSAKKEQVQKMIQLLLKLPSLPVPFDAADALALALCHANNLKKLYV
ncbi:MAG: crossover junction endodeoxyribonuclease RuvC [Chlamydiae bacterium]|nr:crossover junction endodeoxyribonuclease RuvC [Chlamydiota bacterium]